MEPTREQLEILQHSLGIDREKREPWRNYYYTYLDGDAMTNLEGLVEAGLMRRGHEPRGDSRYYHVTDAGKAVAIAGLPKPYTKAQQRYHRFLNAQDAYPDLTFREFLLRTGKERE